jgi:hypothetical protein
MSLASTCAHETPHVILAFRCVAVLVLIKLVARHHRMVSSQVADTEDGGHTYGAAVKKLNMQSQSADKIWSSI